MKRRSRDDEAAQGDQSSSPSLSEVVLVAAGLDEAGQRAYLDTLSPELAEQARQRLAAAAELPDSFLDTPAAQLLDGQFSPAEEPPRSAWPTDERYELGECLGEGGMGRVFAAFDRQLDRPVALKFLQHDDPAILRLFLGEARAQARIQHPHVLEVYDGGKLRDQPFIAMRRVQGGNLAEVAADLPLERKVRLLIHAAEGLHAAHRRGLLHRDVKPSNILIESVDGELEALVADFGLAAKLEDLDSVTDDAVAGSPQFIAPERLAVGPAKIDRRSDVYSLGITMYQVLTDELPFTGQNTVEILRQAAKHPPPAPRTRLPSLPAELEAIVMRCVARDPDQRYSSARAVASDLERFLDGEVVEAYTAGLAYRLTRFVLRNRLLAGMATLALAAMLVASVAVTIFALRADASRQRAELRKGQAEELIRFMVVDLRQRLESLGRLDVLDAASDAASEYFAAVPAQQLSEEEMLRRSRMLYQIGEVRIQQGNLQAAQQPMAESLSLAQRLSQLDPKNSERLFALGQSHFWVGFVSWERGDLASARRSFEDYLDVSRRLFATDAAYPGAQRELLYAHSNLGSVLEAEGDLEGALEQFQRTLGIAEQIAQRQPLDASGQSELAAHHNKVGVVLQALGRLPAANERFRSELELRLEIRAAGNNSPRERELLATSHSYLGKLLLDRGDFSASGEQLHAAHELLRQLITHDSTNTGWRYKLAWSLLDLGRVDYELGDLKSASSAWHRGAAIVDELLALDSTPHDWRRTQAIFHYLQTSLPSSAEDQRLHDGIAQLTELHRQRPEDRRVQQWLSWSHLRLGCRLTSPEAHRQFQQAASLLEDVAPSSRDGRLLAPWARAARCTGRSEEADTASRTLSAMGFAPLAMHQLSPLTEQGAEDSIHSCC